MNFDRLLWGIGSIFAYVGLTGLVENDAIKVGLAGLGVLALAIAADVRVIRKILNEPED